MKYFLLVIGLIPAFVFSQQNTNDFLGKICLSVVMDEQREALTENQKSKIESKIIGIVSRYGVSGKGPANFVINPRFEVYNEQKVEGMQNLFVLTVELNLFIKQTKANIIYSTYTKSLQGTGYSHNEAIVNAISQIDGNDPELGKFIEQGKNKIIAFYNSKCNDILMEADKYANTNDYQRALAILMCVPTEATPCYERIKAKSIEIFKKYQSKQCNQLIQQAKAFEAANQYTNALRILSQIDPTSSCYAESQAIIKSVEAKLDADIKRQWDLERDKMKTKVELEKMQMQLIASTVTSAFGVLGGGGSIWSSILSFLF